MMNGLITGGIVILMLCGGLVVFKMEARQHRKSLLDPRSYRLGFLGMVVYLVMYGVLSIIEKVCFMIGKTPKLRPNDDLVYDPEFFWHPWNVFYGEREE